jgi:hypothetical protein
MKIRTCQILSLGAALSLAPLTSTLAQPNWETTDAALPFAGRDIVADSAGNFISLNLDYTTTNAITSVVRSSDHGATWQTVGSIAGYAVDLTVATDGALFASGNRTVTVSGRAVMWQSLDSGATWTQLDPWAGQSGTFLCLDIASGNSAVYLCGSATGLGSWIVRKGVRSAGGIAWSTADSFPGKQAAAMCVRRGTTGQPDEVLVSGSGLVRRSLDSGTTWTSIDNVGGTGLAAGQNNSIFTTTHTSKSVNVTNWVVVHKKLTAVVTTTTEWGWLVRRSTDGGASWSNVDYVSGGWPEGSSISVDAIGRIFVIGFTDNTSPRTWLVRGSSDGGTTWVTTDSFLPAGATSAQAWGIGIDALGNVCVSGQATIGGLNVAPIRRLAAP